MSSTFFISGIPKAQPRPRAFARNGKAHVYNPATAEGWKSCVALCAKPHAPCEPTAEPVALEIDFLLPRPKAHYFASGEVKPTAPDFHPKKPDLDNLIKAVMDAMTELGFWVDDSQVVSILASKRYATKGNEGAVVFIGDPSAGEAYRMIHKWGEGFKQ